MAANLVVNKQNELVLGMRHLQMGEGFTSQPKSLPRPLRGGYMGGASI